MSQGTHNTWLMENLKVYLEERLLRDKTFRDKTFNIAKNLKFDEYQRDLASMI